jgi:hypothetical protein
VSDADPPVAVAPPTVVAFAHHRAVYTRGVAIAENRALFSGGAPTLYARQP